MTNPVPFHLEADLPPGSKFTLSIAAYNALYFWQETEPIPVLILKPTEDTESTPMLIPKPTEESDDLPSLAEDPGPDAP